MIWEESWRADPVARDFADRHYSRQSIGAKQFVPPGRCVVLVVPQVAYWVTSWPFAEYVKHAWPGAWICSAFRNERRDLKASYMIRDAIAATRAEWPDVPELGMITFVDEDKTKKKDQPGWCFLKAGFRPATPERTKAGLIALQLLPEDMPPAQPAIFSERRPR